MSDEAQTQEDSTSDNNDAFEEDGEISEPGRTGQAAAAGIETTIVQPGTLIFDRQGSAKAESVAICSSDKWDDSALIAAWDAAYLEYQVRHSTSRSPKGVEQSGLKYYKKRRAEDDEILLQRLKKSKTDNTEDGSVQQQHSNADALGGHAGEHRLHHSTQQPGRGAENKTYHSTNGASGHDHSDLPGQATPCVNCGGEINPAQDETTTNLVMSWYWAGYYAGLARGQAQAFHHHEHQYEGGAQPEAQDEPADYRPRSPNGLY
ncbi:hypothetical protein SeMB42_g06808 [Synchytrium endobioticum]|uniref:Survival motor neuron Tudor domain-containing protein n=1 Tax=Synchytrium endobioticum TaxID=286115 RepID=A0A507C8J3_9FUNG|nr:hypothetical protein SeMB42_g06808 [Synchytrium endobioticum]TPX39860.1 hypothetical protein SeLEV6574_g06943 [Synchytrium endobioticum]